MNPEILPRIIFSKNSDLGIRETKVGLTKAELLVLLETDGVVVRFEKTEAVVVRFGRMKSVEIHVREICFKLANAGETEILIYLFSGREKVGYLSYEYDLNSESLNKFYLNKRHQDKFEGMGIMTLGFSILCEVAKARGLKKIWVEINKNNPASIASQRNAMDLFFGKAYRSSSKDKGKVIELTTHLYEASFWFYLWRVLQK